MKGLAIANLISAQYSILINCGLAPSKEGLPPIRTYDKGIFRCPLKTVFTVYSKILEGHSHDRTHSDQGTFLKTWLLSSPY